MKKILFLVSMLLFSVKVNAATYYSNYGEYSEFSPEKKEQTELIEVEKVPFYELYKENIEYVYLEDSDYEETGNSKTIITEWVDDIELLDQTKNIEKLYLYSFEEAKNYKYMVIENTTNRMISIDYLTIYDKIEDRYIDEAPILILYPNDKYVVNIAENNLIRLEIDISMSGYDKSNENISFNISAYLEHPSIANGELLKHVEGDNNNASILINDFSNYKVYGNHNLIPVDAIHESNKELIGLGDPYIMYRNVYDLYEYKIINKEYTNQYSLTDLDDLKIDTTRIKYMYRYRTRDKVTISDNLIINSVDDKLTDFIEESSVDDIEITSDINYSINGLYKINFILPYKTITKDVVVDIKDNYVNLINKQVEYINVLENTTKESTYLTNKKNQEIKEVIVEEETKVLDLNEKLNNCYKEVKDLKKQKENIKEEKKMKEQSFSYVYILIIFIVLLIAYRVNELKKNS